MVPRTAHGVCLLRSGVSFTRGITCADSDAQRMTFARDADSGSQRRVGQALYRDAPTDSAPHAVPFGHVW